jgi:hypothetical protein
MDTSQANSLLLGYRTHHQKRTAATAGRFYCLFRARQPLTASGDNKGMLRLLAPREKDITVTLARVPRHKETYSMTPCRASGLPMTFEVNRTIKDKKNRLYLPLPFRGHGLGGKKTGRIFAPSRIPPQPLLVAG